jgi:hypothetical protein
LPAAFLLFNFLGRFDSSAGKGDLLRQVGALRLLRGDDVANLYPITVDAVVIGRRLEIELTYRSDVVESEVIDRIASGVRRELLARGSGLGSASSESAAGTPRFSGIAAGELAKIAGLLKKADRDGDRGAGRGRSS